MSFRSAITVVLSLAPAQLEAQQTSAAAAKAPACVDLVVPLCALLQQDDAYRENCGVAYMVDNCSTTARLGSPKMKINQFIP